MSARFYGGWHSLRADQPTFRASPDHGPPKDSKSRNGANATALLAKELCRATRAGIRIHRDIEGGIKMANPRHEDKSTQNSDDMARGEKAAEQTTRFGQATAEQATQIGQAAAEAGEEAARVGANLLKENAEAVQNAWRAGLDMTTAVMGRSTNQIGRTLGLSGDEAQQATERSARNAQTILYSTTAVTKAMSGMSREYFELVRHQIENSMERITELWRCRTPQDVAAVQSDLLRDAVGNVLESSRRMADMSLKLADDAAKRMAQEMERIRPAA